MNERRTVTEIMERMTPNVDESKKKREKRMSEIQEAIFSSMIKRTKELLKENGIEIPTEPTK
jgi:hypothetical protein